MPIYEYRCNHCGCVSSVLWRGDTSAEDIRCRACESSEVTRIVSTFAVKRSLTSKLAGLDPKYDGMVERAARNTPEADPARHLRKMTPFSEAEG